MKFYACLFACLLNASCATQYKSKPTMHRKSRCKGWNDPGANTDSVTIHIHA